MRVEILCVRPSALSTKVPLEAPLSYRRRCHDIETGKLIFSLFSSDGGGIGGKIGLVRVFGNTGHSLMWLAFPWEPSVTVDDICIHLDVMFVV